MNSYEQEQLLINAESKNLIQCPYCKTAELLANNYGWAGDEARGYTVRCRCRNMVWYKDSPAEAVLHWNESIKVRLNGV